LATSTIFDASWVSVGGKNHLPIAEECESVASVLLLAAAQETGLLSALEEALPVPSERTPPRFAHLSSRSRRSSLLTLLFLNAVGITRPWDLRSYTGDGLALMTTRKLAYGYWHTERFLTHLVRADAASPLTAALAGWTHDLWTPSLPSASAVYYVDGHRKAVYCDVLIPRGLIGRTGKILGCRALSLLHDEQGHPLLVTTARGDQHLTMGLPSLVSLFETVVSTVQAERMVVDREGMAGDFLAALARAGRTVVTLLRSDQYTGVESFSDVGPFVPLDHDRHGAVIREVAPARFALAIPSEKGASLSLTVALIRDLRHLVPCAVPDDEEPRPWYDDLPDRYAWWSDPAWQGVPAPRPAAAPKLIPIVTTALEADPVELVHRYTARWPVQENNIKDWLLPLGLDTNHGFAKTPVVNSEVASRREALERRLENIRRWGAKAKERSHQASLLSTRLWRETKDWGEAQYRELDRFAQTVEDPLRCGVKHHPQVAERKATIDAQLQKRWDRYHRVFARSNQEHDKHERYCREQRTLLRALEDLASQERLMYEIHHDKDQIMSVCKVALANLGMWVRDRYFPASYAHATWKRLAPFFRLPGRITWGKDMVIVELYPFNDRSLNRDLAEICRHVEAKPLHMPDGRQVRVIAASRPETRAK